ncbi:MAG: hypothetical protein PHH85_09070 [Candidatus Methanoperedens sp.]|nr:hypothetical protein [Candidatus Methanoperedens sp.]
MKIIIEIKPTATLARIEQLSKLLQDMGAHNIMGFADVIESVTSEKT